MQKQIGGKTLGLMAAVSLLSGAQPIWAADSVALEEILVTARKRDERLQDVPESITVLTEAILLDNNVDSIEKLAEITPNLTVNQGFREGLIRLTVRGLGTPQFSESPVSFVVDGATVPSTEFINQGIFDIDNIQVLRGPQGALYGRGALAGAILITTKQPTNEVTGNFQATRQSGDDTRLSGAVSGPLLEDKLLYRIGAYYNDRNGRIENPEGDRLDYIDGEYAVRGMLKLLASDNLTLNFFAKISDGEYGASRYEIAPLSVINDNNTYDTINANYLGQNKREIQEYALQVDWDLGFASLASVTSYSNVEDVVANDADFSLAAAVIGLEQNNKDGFTQELRLTSPGDQDFRWIAGMVYQDAGKEYLYNTFVDDGSDSFPPTGGAQAEDLENDSRNLGVFVHGSWDLTDAFELSGALRYDQDKREFSDNNIGRNDEETFSQLQPKVALSYTLPGDDLLYVSYAKGFRSGGFNALTFAFNPGIYDKEISDSVELGYKSTWFDNRMTLNAALFHVDVDDYQLTLFDVSSFTVGETNLRKVSTQGLELEINAKPTENLELRLGYGYTDAEIDDFDGTGVNDGNDVPFVNRYTLNASVRHQMALTEGLDLVSFVAFNKVGRSTWDPWGIIRTESKEFVNARMTLDFGRWSVAAFADNLFNERSVADAFIWTATDAGVMSNLPRSYGVSARVEF